MTYQEARNELLSAYDRGHGFDTGYYGVAMSDEENPRNGSLRRLWFRIFIRERVHHYTGMSFEKFLSQPRWQIDDQLAEIRPLNKEEHSIAQRIANEAPKNETGA